MNIVIVGGSNTAEYIVDNFKGHHHSLTIINGRKDIAARIARKSKLPVFFGDPTKLDVLEEAHVNGADLFIALGHKDSDNYVSCLLAKKLCGVKKCICIVQNPKNIEVFKQLGIDSVISSTETLVSSILSESSLESIIKTMTLENNKIVISEITVKPNYLVAHKHISEMNFPKTGSISAIYRRPRVIIPNGSTLILPKDKLLIISSPDDQNEIIDFVQKSN